MPWASSGWGWSPANARASFSVDVERHVVDPEVEATGRRRVTRRRAAERLGRPLQRQDLGALEGCHGAPTLLRELDERHAHPRPLLCQRYERAVRVVAAALAF